MRTRNLHLWLIISLFIAICNLPFAIPNAMADDAQVLPKGVFRIGVRTLYTFYDERFDPSGKKEAIGIDFDKVNVTRAVFPALGTLETTLGLPAGSLTLGTTSFDSDVEIFALPIYVEYGLTDMVSLGIVIPFIHVQRDVSFSISGGNVGFSPTGSLLPVGVGGVTRPIDTEDVQTILQSPVYGYQLRRFEDFSNTGLGDIRFGFKHQYLKREDFRLAYTLSLRLPTGDADDPDNLLDVALGDGQADVVIELHSDYLPTRGSLINLYIRYTIQLPDKEVRRIQTSANEPIAPMANRQKVERDLGDIIEVEGATSYNLLEALNLSLRYRFLYKSEDQVKSPTGANTMGLTAETLQRSHEIGASLAYSTLPAFQRKVFPLPMVVHIEYQNILDGVNVNKATTIGLGMRIFF